MVSYNCSVLTVAWLGLNGRDFTQLATLTPGFANSGAGGYGSLNGTRANQINWQIDGVDNNDLANHGLGGSAA